LTVNHSHPIRFFSTIPTDIYCVAFAQNASQYGLIGAIPMRENSIEPTAEDYAVDSGSQTGRLGGAETKRMSNDNDQTNPPAPEFDFSAFPDNTVFHERRLGRERRTKLRTDSNPESHISRPTGERRAKKERRKRIDPTTFEKQYSDDEMEFMNAVQRFKEQSGKGFPTYGEVLRVAVALGYRKCTDGSGSPFSDVEDREPMPDPSSLVKNSEQERSPTDQSFLPL
jgi:hypothetical protein